MSIDTQTLLHLQKLFKKPRIFDAGKKKSIDPIQMPIKDGLFLETEDPKHPLLDVELSELHGLFEPKPTTTHECYKVPLFVPIKNKANDELLIKRKPENIIKILLEHKITKAKETLDLKGTLKMTPDGFVYLKVDNAFFDIITPCFKSEGGQIPPFFERYFNPGAHIGVMTRDEVFINSLKGSLDELDQSFPFSIKGCSKIELSQASPYEYIWVLHIESIELEWLREKYHLPIWYLSREFMMILAVKSRGDFGKHSIKEDVQYVVNPCTCAV